MAAVSWQPRAADCSGLQRFAFLQSVAGSACDPLQISVDEASPQGFVNALGNYRKGLQGPPTACCKLLRPNQGSAFSVSSGLALEVRRPLPVHKPLAGG